MPGRGLRARRDRAVEVGHPGIEQVPHYIATGDPRAYAGKSVVVIGKRNSGFEIADGLLPWARRIVLLSPRPVQTSVLALSSVRVRYMQPLEDDALGGGTLVLDAAVERVERAGEATSSMRRGRRARASSPSRPTRSSPRPGSGRRSSISSDSRHRPSPRGAFPR